MSEPAHETTHLDATHDAAEQPAVVESDNALTEPVEDVEQADADDEGDEGRTAIPLPA